MSVDLDPPTGNWRSGAAVCGSFFLLVMLVVAPLSAGEKSAETSFKLSLGALHAVGAFPLPGSNPYFVLWPWAPWWGIPGPYVPIPYPAAPYGSTPYAVPPTAPPTSASGYPPQVKPAGRLVILTDPIDAGVYVDGVRLQQRPDLLYEVGLLAGPHQVDIRKEGFAPFSYKAEIPPGGGLMLPVQLEKR